MSIIYDLDSTIEALMMKEFLVVERHRGEREMPFDISFAIPSRDSQLASTGKPTINFYLYDVRENTELRSNEPLIKRRNDGTIVKKQPPARILLSYCVTAWSSSTTDDAAGTKTRDEHKLLSDVLAALIKYPTIPAKVLKGDLKNQTPPPTTLILPDGMKNPAEFWNALDGPLKPFLDYRVTVSLDFHDFIKGRMVTAKVGEYGNMSPVYILSIRPDSRLDHPKNTLLTKAKIEQTPIVNLKDASNEELKVSRTQGLNPDDILMIVDGKNTEFCQIKEIISSKKISISQSLAFPHEAGTELKRLSLSPAVDIKLARAASPKIPGLQVKGHEVAKLKIGEVLRLDDADKAEYFQITQVSGPEIGLGDADTLVQFGGIVTNSANAPLVGAKVMLLNAQGSFVAETTSNDEGRYRFKKFGIGKGNYTLKVEAEGYKEGGTTINEITSAKFEDFMITLESG